MSSLKLRLMCLVWPDDNPDDHIAPVKFNDDDTVADLKKLIKVEYARRLHNSDASDLVLWKCSIPADDNLQEKLKTVRFDVTHPLLQRLPPASLVSKHFTAGLSPETLHILVEVPVHGEFVSERKRIVLFNSESSYIGSDAHLEHAEKSDVVKLAENMRFLNIVNHSGKPPSTAAKSNEYVKIQAMPEFAIHDGLYPKPMTNSKSTLKPMTTVAPPVQIFHPIFEQFIRDANDPHLDLPREFLIQIQEFMAFASQLKTSESASNPEWRQLLSKLLQIGIHEDQNADGTRPDGISTIDITALGECVPFFIWEYKRILGEGGCDPSVQAGYSTRRAWIQCDRSIMRDRCCCPTFIIAGGGPWMCVLGAVFTDKVIVQRLTDMIWIGLSSTNEDAGICRFARVMMALCQNLPELLDYYEKISTADIPPFKEGSPHPRFYPYHTSFIENDKLVFFDYVRMLEDDPTCVTYLAKIRKDVESPNIDELIVVKFVDRYSQEVHQFLADKGYSPKLRYYGPLEVDNPPGNDPSPAPLTTASPGYLLSGLMTMVVMGYVKPQHRPADAYAQLERILTDLHVEGYVFGDLQEPNILFDKDGKVQLIDLNWAGRYNMEQEDPSLLPDLKQKIRQNIGRVQGSALTEFVKYPLSLSPNVSWAHGVGALLPIRPQHDWEMLRKLQWRSI